jgi:hypothetical protein
MPPSRIVIGIAAMSRGETDGLGMIAAEKTGPALSMAPARLTLFKKQGAAAAPAAPATPQFPG